MANGWTAERRARQAALIWTWRPWEQSTGPKTERGKAAASVNAMKHGLRSTEWLGEQKHFQVMLRSFGELLVKVRD